MAIRLDTVICGDGCQGCKSCRTDVSDISRDQVNKKDAGKPPMELIDPDAIVELARVLEFGANKYAANNWREGIEWTRVTAAILRHTFAFLNGETFDPETGLNHMAHVMCEAMFLVNFAKTHRDKDDRYQSIEDLPWETETKDNEKFYTPQCKCR